MTALNTVGTDFDSINSRSKASIFSIVSSSLFYNSPIENAIIRTADANRPTKIAQPTKARTVLDSVAQHVDGATLGDLALQPGQERAPRGAAVGQRQRVDGLRLGVAQERRELHQVDAVLAVVVVEVATAPPDRVADLPIEDAQIGTTRSSRTSARRLWSAQRADAPARRWSCSRHCRPSAGSGSADPPRGRRRRIAGGAPRRAGDGAARPVCVAPYRSFRPSPPASAGAARADGTLSWTASYHLGIASRILVTPSRGRILRHM